MASTAPASAVPRALTQALAWFAAVGPLIYVVFVSVLGSTWDGYDPVRDTQSELGARLHSVFSAPGAITVPIAMMVAALAFGRDGRFSTSWSSVSFWLLRCRGQATLPGGTHRSKFTT